MQHLTARIPSIARTVVAVACLLLTWAITAAGKEWRGIVPLHSTRADVERLLGTPTEKVGEGGYFYDLQNEAAVIWFETSGCNDESSAAICGWALNVPVNTVTSIGVVYKNRPLASDFTGGGGFKEELVCAGLAYYRNEGEGIEVESYRGRVLSVSYSGTAADGDVRCPPQAQCTAPHDRKYDEYGNIRFGDEKARLDNVAVELQTARFFRLALLAYGGRKSRPREAIKRAERAKDYLVKVRRIPPWQIVAADCGYREDLTVELLPLPLAGRVYPSPTVDPSEVVIPPASKSRRRDNKKPND